MGFKVARRMRSEGVKVTGVMTKRPKCSSEDYKILILFSKFAF